MSTWVPIHYMGFYDVPLIFLVAFRGEAFLFDCEFDEALEDYADHYKVYLMSELRVRDLPADWTTLRLKASKYLGQVPVDKVRFDPTKRRAIDAAQRALIRAVRRVVGQKVRVLERQLSYLATGRRTRRR